MDTSITVNEMRHWIKEFDDQRDWHQCHSPIEIAVYILLGAAELRERFQWQERRYVKNGKSTI